MKRAMWRGKIANLVVGLIAYRVVDHHVVGLHSLGCLPNNMDHLYSL
jgi:hypothetical protein